MIGKIRDALKTTWKELPIRRMRQKGLKLSRFVNELELFIRLKGVKMMAILDSGGPITKLPKRLTTK